MSNINRLYRVIREVGARTGQRKRPHALRHTAISEAVRKIQAIGIDLAEALQFLRQIFENSAGVYRPSGGCSGKNSGVGN